MRVELIDDKEPRGLRIGGDGLGDMRREVFFRSAGPEVGATTSPVATSKLAIKHCVPWRRYSYSGRSTRPGCIGKVGAARSSACIPVFSSVLMTWPPSCGQGWRLLVHFTHGSHLGGKRHGVIRLGVEPVLDPMGL